MQLRTAGLLLIKERKLLLAYSKNKQCFYLPGGKADDTETTVQALCREIQEELNVELKETDLSYYTHITAPAFGEQNGVVMEQDCFMCLKEIDPVPSAEIGRLHYFIVEEYTMQPQTAPGAVQILEQLKRDHLID